MRSGRAEERWKIEGKKRQNECVYEREREKCRGFVGG